MKATKVTPSGVKLYYQSEPKRLYKVNGKIVPSVTEILGVLDKPALVWWGMKVGVEGVLTLLHNMDIYFDLEYDELRLGKDQEELTVDRVVDELTAKELTVNHVRDKAGVRGNSAHDALEKWAKEGVLVDSSQYPEQEQGYVQGVLNFIEAAEPRARATEVMVGSPVHAFAGRYDLLADQPDGCEVVVRNLKRKNKTEVLPEGRYLYDLKTTKRVYPTHHLQLAAYEGGSRECGYEPTDHRAVVLVGADGTYEVHRSPFPCYDQFLAVRAAHAAMQTFKKGR